MLRKKNFFFPMRIVKHSNIKISGGSPQVRGKGVYGEVEHGFTKRNCFLNCPFYTISVGLVVPTDNFFFCLLGEIFCIFRKQFWMMQGPIAIYKKPAYLCYKNRSLQRQCQTISKLKGPNIIPPMRGKYLFCLLKKPCIRFRDLIFCMFTRDNNVVQNLSPAASSVIQFSHNN